MQGHALPVSLKRLAASPSHPSTQIFAGRGAPPTPVRAAPTPAKFRAFYWSKLPSAGAGTVWAELAPAPPLADPHASALAALFAVRRKEDVLSLLSPCVCLAARPPAITPAWDDPSIMLDASILSAAAEAGGVPRSNRDCV